MEITRVYLSCLKGVENVGFPSISVIFILYVFHITFCEKKMAETFGYNLYVSILTVIA